MNNIIRWLYDWITGLYVERVLKKEMGADGYQIKVILAPVEHEFEIEFMADEELEAMVEKVGENIH